MKTIKKVEYTVSSETGKIDSLTIGGKSKAMRDLNKAQNAPYWKLFFGSGYGINPMSGEEVLLTPLELSIYNFCTMWYRGYDRGTEKLPIQVFDSMKYLLMDLNPDAYMKLLD